MLVLTNIPPFWVQQLGFGRKAATVPLADGEPGVDFQVDPGCVGFTEPDEHGRRRQIVSHYRFVAVIEHETTAEVIAAFEAAWAFFGGIFQSVIVDNLKAVVQRADPTEPLINPIFQEFAQKRGFVIDPGPSAACMLEDVASSGSRRGPEHPAPDQEIGLAAILPMSSTACCRSQTLAVLARSSAVFTDRNTVASKEQDYRGEASRTLR